MAMAKSLFFLAPVLLLVLPFSLAATNPPLDIVGSYGPIKNITDPHIQSLGEFAVNEHNKQAKTQLQFQEVISGLFQIVSGINYQLRLTALEGTVSRTYGTVVYKDLTDKNHLIAFFGISN